MLMNISHEKFAVAIYESYSTLDADSARTLAEKLVQTIDEEIEPAVIAWIDGKEIPDIQIGQYSVNKIMTIRNNTDYLEAFQLLTEFKDNPAVGEKKIWTPKRIRQQKRQ